MNKSIKILITGAGGFIGSNLVHMLKTAGYTNILEFRKGTDSSILDKYTSECGFVFHLAGINRPQNESEFFEGNVEFTRLLLDSLKKNQNKSPVLFTSSIQAELDNPYGKSKKAGEELLFDYQRREGIKALVYRLPNVFGKWCRPNYNSVVATFCSNIANNLPINISDPDKVLNLVYIDDVVSEFIGALEGSENRADDFCYVKPVHTTTLGELADLIYGFYKSRQSLILPDLSDPFVKKLYATYLSYLPAGKFGYKLKTNEDHRGSFTEFLKTISAGQVSINISKPGAVKGNHWHSSKCEKFLVVYGRGEIRLRKVDDDKVISYKVSGDNLEVIDIPPGYTHSIANLGDSDMVTVMWVNEVYDPESPDTYYLQV